MDMLYRVVVVNNFASLFIGDRYQIKGGGLVFMDSNFGAVLSGVFLIMAKQFFESQSERYIFNFVCILIILASKSMAVLLGLVFCYVFYPLFTRISHVQLFFLVTTSTILIFYSNILNNILPVIANYDGSAGTKVEIMIQSITILGSGSFNFLTGIGLGNFVNYSSWGAHNFVGLFVELGVFGFIILVFPMIYAWRRKGNRVAVTFLFLSGLSVYPMTYIALPMICLFIRQPRSGINNIKKVRMRYEAG